MEARKRGRSDGFFNGNGGGGGGGFKKNKQEMENFSPGIGSKSKPCTKFFSTTGCQFGESCHFLHFIPGGFNAAAQMTNHSHPPSSRNNPMNHPPHMGGSNGPSATAVKTRLCNKINTPEGCKFGDKCHFAHSEKELGKSSNHEGRPMGQRFQPPQDVAEKFGVSSAAKISVDASLAGAIIGRGGVNSKHICQVTGAHLSIRDNEADPTIKNIELEGTFDQIKHASNMVRDLIVNISSGGPPPSMHPSAGPPAHRVPSANNFKTKLCENFTKGKCTFGDRCHFAHGDTELRQSSGAVM